jgi:hypothetical protein
LEYKKYLLGLYITIVAYGGVGLWFNNANVLLFQSCGAAVWLVNLILFQLILLRYIFYMVSFCAIIGIYA